MIERRYRPCDQATRRSRCKETGHSSRERRFNDEPANAMCYRKKGSGTIGNDSCIRQHSLGVFFFLFPFFPTGPENGTVDILLQIQQEGLLLLARHLAPGGFDGNESRSGTA